MVRSKGDAAQDAYVASKKRIADSIGIGFEVREVQSEAEAKDAILRVASESKCKGIILQLPLSFEADTDGLLNSIPAEKDIDVLSEEGKRKWVSGENNFTPPAVGALKHFLGEVPGWQEKKIAIVGRGRLVGRPIAKWLEKEEISHEVFDEGRPLFPQDAKDFDVFVLGVGKHGVLGASDCKEGAVVVDFGYSKDADGRLVGDFDASGAEEKGIIYTKTPGGTGPVLVACLFENAMTGNHSRLVVFV